MENTASNTVKEKPKTNLAQRVMYLGLGAVVATVLSLGIFNSAMRGMLNTAFNSEYVGGTVGLVLGIVALALSLYALVLGIRAFKAGERSRELWVGFVPSIILSVFWILAIVAETFFME